MADKAATPPQNIDAEESILGAMMLTPRAIEAVAELVSPTDFYRPSHGAIFAACLELYAANEPVDAITLTARLAQAGQLKDVGGEARIHELAALVPAAGNAAHYARLVREAAEFRSLISFGTELTRLGWEQRDTAQEAVEQAERLMYDLAQQRNRHGGFTNPAEAVDRAFARLRDLAAAGKDIVGLPTGFTQLDRMTSGLHPGNLVLLAARPSIGKSALAFAIMANAVLRQDPPVPVALFTLEMNEAEVMTRLVEAEALVDSERMRSPHRMNSDDWGRAQSALGKLSNAPIFINDKGAPSMTEIRSESRRLKLRQPDLGLIVIDYVQLLSSGTRAESRNNEISQISRALKMMAGELDLPVLLLSQLSREVERRHDKRPMLSDLRDSGALEADADVVLMLYRDEYYFPETAEEDGTAGIAEVNVAKQRNGPTGMRKIAWQKRYARFTDLAEGGMSPG